MSHPAITPEILPLGQDGIVVRFARAVSPEASAAVARFSEAAKALPVVEIAPALASVMLRFDPRQERRSAIEPALREILAGEWTGLSDPKPKRRWHIPVVLDGPGLTESAQMAGVTVEDAIKELTEHELRVRAIGFAPGLPYLGFLPEHWNIARQQDLTPRVEAGALVVAVRQFVLFPTASKTGWRQVGRAAFRPFRPEARAPFLLQAGDAVRLEQVAKSEWQSLENTELGGAHCEELA